MPGAIDDIARFLYLAGIILMAIQCRKNQYLSQNINGFLLSFLITLVPMFCLHLCYLRKGSKSVVIYCKHRIMIYGLIIFSTIVALLLRNTGYYVTLLILFGNVFMLLLTSFNTFRVTEDEETRERKHKKLEEEAHPNELDEIIEDHFLERFGLFVMITAGESILALVIASKDWDYDKFTYALVVTAFLMVYLLKTLYFSYHVNLEDGHALMNSSSPGAVAFCIIHLFLCLTVLWIGSAWKLLFYYYRNDPVTTTKVRVNLGVAVVCALLCLTFYRFTHSKYTAHILSLLRLIPIGLCLFICFYLHHVTAITSGLLVCILIILVLDFKFYNRGYEIVNHKGEGNSFKNLDFGWCCRWCCRRKSYDINE